MTEEQHNHTQGPAAECYRLEIDAVDPDALPLTSGVDVRVIGGNGMGYLVELSAPSPAALLAYVAEHWGLEDEDMVGVAGDIEAVR